MSHKYTKADLPLSRDLLYTANSRAIVLTHIAEVCRIGDKPIFTAKAHKRDLISLEELYVEYCVDDPSEATFALAVFGDISYWMTARELPKMKPWVEHWREVADIHRKSMAYKAVINEVKEGGRSAFSAAKYLIDEPNKNKQDPAVRKQVKKTKEAAKQDALESHIPEGMEDFVKQHTKMN